MTRPLNLSEAPPQQGPSLAIIPFPREILYPVLMDKSAELTDIGQEVTERARALVLIAIAAYMT